MSACDSVMDLVLIAVDVRTSLRAHQELIERVLGQVDPLFTRNGDAL